MLEEISYDELKVGKFSLLDKEHMKQFEQKKLDANNVEKAEVCELEYMLIKHLLKENEITLTNEIKYRLTNGEDTVSVLLDAIKKKDYLRDTLWMIESKLEEYVHTD